MLQILQTPETILQAAGAFTVFALGAIVIAKQIFNRQKA